MVQGKYYECIQKGRVSCKDKQFSLLNNKATKKVGCGLVVYKILLYLFVFKC